jgi:hypothetical protein
MEFPKIVGALRSYNMKMVLKQAERLHKLGLGGLIVTGDGRLDMNTTEYWLSKAKIPAGWCTYIPVQYGYSWSYGLTVCREEALAQNDMLENADEPQRKYILYISNEVLLPVENLQKMYDCAEAEGATMVGTTFVGREDNNVVPLNWPYQKIIRNTCNLSLLNDPFGHHDFWCDQKEVGGLEDFDRMERTHMGMGVTRLLDLETEVIVGNRFAIPAKELRELGAAEQIGIRARGRRGVGAKRDRLENMLDSIQYDQAMERLKYLRQKNG